jgi:hypothetical protein
LTTPPLLGYSSGTLTNRAWAPTASEVTDNDPFPGQLRFAENKTKPAGALVLRPRSPFASLLARGEVVMPAKKIVIPAKKIAQARFLYEQTLTPLADVAALLEISRGTLVSRVNEWGWQPRCDNPHARGFQRYRHGRPAPGEAKPAARGYPQVAEERLALVERLRGAVDKQIAHVDSILARAERQLPDEAERTGRMLAGLARTLREMMRLEIPAPPEIDDDTDVPRNLDDLRRELLRKMDAIIAGRAHSAAGES